MVRNQFFLLLLLLGLSTTVSGCLGSNPVGEEVEEPETEGQVGGDEGEGEGEDEEEAGEGDDD